MNENGRALEDARVEVNSLEGERLASVRTNGRGRFTIDRPDVGFAFTVHHPETSSVFWSPTQLHSPGPWRIPLPAIVAGRRLSGMAEGASLVEAWRYSNDEGDVFRVDVEDDGYSMVLPPGRYALRTPGAIGFPVTVNLETEDANQDLEVTPVTPTSDRVVEALLPSVVRLTDNNLQPLPDLDSFRGARVVGLGESTHGTAEFFEVKHGVFRQLVEAKRVTSLAMEANVLGAESVEAYLQGQGSLDDAIKGLFLLWRTEEVKDLLVWIRAHNATSDTDEQLHFSGYDVQDIKGPYNLIADFIADARPGWMTTLEPVERVVASPKSVTEVERQEAMAAAESVLERLLDERETLIESTSVLATNRAVLGARLLVLGLPVIASASGQEYFAARDQGMADNVQRILETLPEDETLVVWAHNGHIAHDSAGLLGTNMGTHLKTSLGEAYVSVGLHTRTGTYTASASRETPRQAVVVPIDASAPGFYAEGLSRLGSRFLLDLRRATPAGRAWLAGPRWHHSCGWLAPDGHDRGAPVSLLGRFDAILFLDETHGAERL